MRDSESMSVTPKRGVNMSSPSRISANRENALKSTGPRSERGKSKSRLNALKSGIYAKALVLTGEDENAVRAIEKEYRTHFAPVGPVENLLVSQITLERLRLIRIEKAENTLPNRLVEGRIIKLLKSCSEREIKYFKEIYAGELSEEIAQAHRALEAAGQLLEIQNPGAGRLKPAERSDEEMQDGIEGSLDRILAPENILQDCLIPEGEPAPQSYLAKERRAAVRNYISLCGKLQQCQETRMTVTLLPKLPPKGCSDLT